MIDLTLLRENPDLVRQSLQKRQEDAAVVDRILEHDRAWRVELQKLEALQAERNGLTKTKQSAQANKSRLAALKKQLEAAKPRCDKANSELQQLLLSLPNVVADDVPTGDASANKVLATSGEPTLKSGQPHEELMKKRGWINLEVAGRWSGARLRYLLGDAARAERQLFNEAIDFAISKGFELVLPPTIARSELLTATGFFPRGQEDTFQIADDQYLIGTSEQTLLALFANQTFRRDELPKRLVGFTTCYRQEAGSAGRDVRGMFRQHQFDKVELVSVCYPDDAAAEHDYIVAIQEEFVRSFALPYQKVLLASGDQSAIAAKQIDIETWFPGQSKYRETHSASNCTDFQARLLKVRVSDGEETVLAHTLNGTIATERLLLAIIENNQDKDGQVSLPPQLL